MVYVPVGIQGCVILDHTNTENQNEAKRESLYSQALKKETLTPLSEKDEGSRLNSRDFGLKEAIIV